MSMEQKSKYVAPSTRRVTVELEQGFMSASIFEDENKHDEGLSTEEHGFADPTKQWEGNYGESEWN